jgi:hypothetical protein
MYAFQLPAEVVALTVPGWCLGDVLLTDGAFALIDSGEIDLDAVLSAHLRAASSEGWVNPAAGVWTPPQFFSFLRPGLAVLNVVSQRGQPDSRIREDQTVVCLADEA